MYSATQQRQIHMTDEDRRIIKSEFEARESNMAFAYGHFVERIRSEAEVAVGHLVDELAEAQGCLASEAAEISNVEVQAAVFKNEHLQESGLFANYNDAASAEFRKNNA